MYHLQMCEKFTLFLGVPEMLGMKPLNQRIVKIYLSN